ncbi:MAG TPA: hypothetical protein VMY34_05560 [Acidimicrobiales bacterium]|nr:hypothetical protein [Acidimicrobiales bacterium]
MDARLRFFCYLAAAACFGIAALGGTRRGKAGQPNVLVPLGLLLFVIPTLWDSGAQAF